MYDGSSGKSHVVDVGPNSYDVAKIHKNTGDAKKGSISDASTGSWLVKLDSWH